MECTFKELRILKFPDIYFLQRALFMFKIDRNLLPSRLIKCFYQNSEIRHCPRPPDSYHLELVNTDLKGSVITTKVRFHELHPTLNTCTQQH